MLWHMGINEEGKQVTCLHSHHNVFRVYTDHWEFDSVCQIPGIPIKRGTPVLPESQ